MTLPLFFLAAAAAYAPQSDSSSQAGQVTAARAMGRVSLQILEGARIAASEARDVRLPPLQDSRVAGPDGELRAARLVEFE